MKHKTLHEYKCIFIGRRDDNGNRAVTRKVFEELERFVLQNSDIAQFLKIGYKKGLGKVLQAQNYVGVIQTKDGMTIEILPKITERNREELDDEASRQILIRMLQTLKNSPFKSLHKAHLKTAKMPLFEIFISMFLDELAILVRKGIRSDYIENEENLRFLKGKLKLQEQLKYNYIHKERFFVAHDEYSSDRVENRLIKTTLQYFYKKSKFTKNQQRIREFLFVFDEIGLSKDFKKDFTKIRIDRQMRDYEQVLLWCKTFLLGESFTPYKGESVAFALLFDMNRLFESYVYDYLKRYGGYRDITAQDRTHYLAWEGTDGKFRLRPDIVIRDHETIVIDTKWKLLSREKTNQGISQSDMYQLYAYGKKYGATELYLIYPLDGNAGESEYHFYGKDKDQKLNLYVRFFDVSRRHSQQYFTLEGTVLCP